MSEGRLPAHLEVSALIRAAESAGGFATILRKGERDAGTILILTVERGRNARLWERMPRLDGRRIFESVKAENQGTGDELSEKLDRRMARDRDLWLVELDIADAERFIADYTV